MGLQDRFKIEHHPVPERKLATTRPRQQTTAFWCPLLSENPGIVYLYDIDRMFNFISRGVHVFYRQRGGRIVPVRGGWKNLSLEGQQMTYVDDFIEVWSNDFLVIDGSLAKSFHEPLCVCAAVVHSSPGSRFPSSTFALFSLGFWLAGIASRSIIGTDRHVDRF